MAGVIAEPLCDAYEAEHMLECVQRQRAHQLCLLEGVCLLDAEQSQM